jgi:hypothetical protein
MKKEVCLKFRLPKDEYKFSIYENAEEFHEALVCIHKFLNSGNLDLTMEDIQGYFKDVTVGLPL